MHARCFRGFLGAALLLLAGSGQPASAQSVGPVDPINGFPQSYTDKQGLTLAHCLDDELLCLLPGPPPTGFPTGFPDESFYQRVDGLMDTSNGGQALMVLALEAAFLNGPVVPGEQMTFGRVRFRVDNLQAGQTYRVTYPYGVVDLVAQNGGTRGINVTTDIGCAAAPCDFTAALASPVVNGLLSWDPLSDAPAGYVGDPGVEHAITGSPVGQNLFRIEGPNVGAPGSPFLCRPDRTDCIETRVFFVSGKLAPASVVCGDGVLGGAETCDDGNLAAGDGCDSSCIQEAGFLCAGEPSVCTSVCGDGLTRGAEQCDDANLAAGDGCSGTCSQETGFVCTGEPSACRAVCGDGLVRGNEQCDDGNLAGGDGCNATCAVETGFSCSGEPSTCTTGNPPPPTGTVTISRTRWDGRKSALSVQGSVSPIGSSATLFEGGANLAGTGCGGPKVADLNARRGSFKYQSSRGAFPTNPGQVCVSSDNGAFAVAPVQ